MREKTHKSATSGGKRARRVAHGRPFALRVLKRARPLPNRLGWLKQEREVTRGLNQLACQPAPRSRWQNQPAHVPCQWN